MATVLDASQHYTRGLYSKQSRDKEAMESLVCLRHEDRHGLKTGSHIASSMIRLSSAAGGRDSDWKVPDTEATFVSCKHTTEIRSWATKFLTTLHRSRLLRPRAFQMRMLLLLIGE